MDRLAIEQPVHVLRLARVAAQQAVLAENPQVARPGDRLIGRLGNLVRVGKPLLHPRIEQLGQLVFGEANEPQVDVHSLQVGQLDRQQLVIPGGHIGGLVVGDSIRLGLGGREALGHVDGGFFQAEFQGGRPYPHRRDTGERGATWGERR